MNMHSSSENEPKKLWIEPAIVLERPLLHAAQEATPVPGGRRPGRLRGTGLISPMNGSGTAPNCSPPSSG